ncbi:MAG: xcpT 4 [Phycisphaerales bacterium]|nr:xcpT 4 [Phycisphaerales bacterium]
MRQRKAFTLVELLVVIGIIALLISILLPSLNRARQQANLIKCSSNLRSIGQMLQIYVSENKGFAPYGQVDSNIQTGAMLSYTGLLADAPAPWYWCDTLAIMMKQKPSNIPGYTLTALRYPKVFEDTDAIVQDAASYGRESQINHYTGHPRIFAYIDSQYPILDPYGSKRSWSSTKVSDIYKIASVRRSSDTFMMWCGSQDTASPNAWADPVALQMDGGRSGYESWGYFPAPANPTDGSVATWTDYAAACTLNSQYVVPETITTLKAENRDYDHGKDGYHWGVFRFRHMKNTTINLMAVDGHVESRQIGNLTRKEISVQR